MSSIVTIPIDSLPANVFAPADPLAFNKGGITFKGLSKKLLAGLNTVPVSDVSDFPTPINDVITLESKLYLLKGPVDIGINRFDIPNGVIAVIRGENPFETLTSAVSLVTNPLFTIQQFGTLDIENFDPILTGLDARFVDTVTGGLFFWENSGLVFTGTGVTAIGKLDQAFAVQIEDVTSSGHKSGLIYENVVIASINGVASNFGVAAGTGTDAFITITGAATGSIVINQLISNTGPNESVISIDASIIGNPNVSIRITNLLNSGTGTEFKTTGSGSYTGITNVTLNKSVTTVEGTVSNPAIFVISSGIDFSNGDIIDHTAFDVLPTPQVSYNGEDLEVFDVGVGNANGYKVKRPNGTTINFIANRAGTAKELLLEFAATAHGLNVGDGVILFGNANYNLAAIVVTPVTTNQFRIRKRANNVTGQTGTFKKGSLESNSLNVNVSDTDELPTSTIRGGFFASLGTAPSSAITATEFNDFIFPPNRKPFEDNEGIEYNVNPTNGEIKIISLKKKQKIIIPLSITLDPNTGTNVNSSILIKLLIDRNDGLGFIPLSDDIETNIFFRGTSVTANINREINANPGDKIKFQGKSSTSGEDIIPDVTQADIMV